MASLRLIVETLRRHYGAPRSLAPKDPFQLLLWEYVAYLADDPARAAAFAELRKVVGLRPAEIAAAPLPILATIARKGGAIAAAVRAGRMRDVATTVRDDHGGTLAPAVKLPYGAARKILRKFPSIGPPGADKILLLSGARPVLAMDSNALRVALRLGYGQEHKSYAASYASAQEAASAELPATVPSRREAFLLLQHHGRELCRRSAPRCADCPVRASCEFFRRSR
jgi:endonuclease III